MIDEHSPHLIGEGQLVVPPAESDSRRYGTVILLDDHGKPVPLRQFKAIGTAVLTATIPAPIAEEFQRPDRPELLGAGVLFFERSSWKGSPALAAGVRPRDGRLAWWLEPSTLAGLRDVPVVLEAHESWPGCRCKPAEPRPRRRKRAGRQREHGGAA